MSRKPHQAALDLGTLGDLSAGQSAAIIDAALRAAIRDTEDRGADKKPRKVVIEIELKKTGPDHVSVNVTAKTSLPKYATDPTVGELVMDGNKPRVMFSPAAADNPDQPAIPGTHNDD